MMELVFHQRLDGIPISFHRIFYSYPKYPSSSYSQVPSFDHWGSTTQSASMLHCQDPAKVHTPLQDPAVVDIDAPPPRTTDIVLRFRALPNFSFDFTFFLIAIVICFLGKWIFGFCWLMASWYDPTNTIVLMWLLWCFDQWLL